MFGPINFNSCARTRAQPLVPVMARRLVEISTHALVQERNDKIRRRYENMYSISTHALVQERNHGQTIVLGSLFAFQLMRSYKSATEIKAAYEPLDRKFQLMRSYKSATCANTMTSPGLYNFNSCARTRAQPYSPAKITHHNPNNNREKHL